MSRCTVYVTVLPFGISKKTIQQVVFFTLKKTGHEGSVSVHCIGEKRMRGLNRLHRGVDRPTDVLSFSALEGMPPVADPDETDIGDIFIAIPVIKRQAKRFGITFRDEFYRMLVHGVLHLVGYDHEQKNDAERMFFLQESIVKKIV